MAVDEKADKKITGLLAEYNTLRAEVIAAQGSITQAGQIFFAAATAIVAFAYTSSDRPWLVGAIAIVALAFLIVAWTWRWNGRNTQILTRRLREIEAEVNRLAGDEILTWETHHGWGGMFSKSNPGFRG